MIFSHVEFLILFVITAVSLQRADPSWRRAILATASLVFIFWAGLSSFLLFLAVVFLTWSGMRVAARRERLSAHSVGAVITVLLLNLFLWKYWGWISAEFGLPADDSVSRFILEQGLPIGISFYTLQAIAFLIEVHRGTARAVGFLDVLLFESFFGQLIAGPIVRNHELMPQVKAPPRASREDILSGIELFALGFFKKMVLADKSANYADPIFANPSAHSGIVILFGVVLYTVQIWCDFSGYVDMGRGAARVCGIHLPENFRSPYLATSPSDFWRRWHITLSLWIRDFVYFPMGGSRQGLFKTLRNLLIAMALVGLWHGAAWTFVLWGVYHGILLCIQRLWRHLIAIRLHASFQIPLMLVAVMIGWVFFRAETLSDIAVIFQSLLGITLEQFVQSLTTDGRLFAVAIVFFLLTLCIQVMEASEGWRERYRRVTAVSLRGALVGAICSAAIMFRGEPAPFIYFQF